MNTWQEQFVAMAEEIRRHLSVLLWRACRSGDECDEAIQDCTANICVAFKRMVQNGTHANATASTLAKYAFRHWTVGRTACGSTQKYNAIRRGDAIPVFESISTENAVCELHDAYQFTPAELACFKIDFAEWTDSLTDEQRTIVEYLADGHRVCDIAKIIGISAWRVYEARDRIKQTWNDRQCELQSFV